ncbi:MAG: hypothetical protein ACRDR6_10095 [Pseudonocardiaceae bacterium]
MSLAADELNHPTTHPRGLLDYATPVYDVHCSMSAAWSGVGVAMLAQQRAFTSDLKPHEIQIVHSVALLV